MPNDKPNTFDLKDPASAAAFRASMGRALKPRPKVGEVLGPDGKPVTPVEMKELKPYELEPGDEAVGDHWGSIRRTESELSHFISFTCHIDADTYTSFAHRDGQCELNLPSDISWRQATAYLGEILKTARANYGEDWGK